MGLIVANNFSRRKNKVAIPRKTSVHSWTVYTKVQSNFMISVDYRCACWANPSLMTERYGKSYTQNGIHW